MQSFCISPSQFQMHLQPFIATDHGSQIKVGFTSQLHLVLYIRSLIFAPSPLRGCSHSLQSLRGFCFLVFPPSIDCPQKAGAGRVNLHFPHSLPHKKAQKLLYTAASLVPLCKGRKKTPNKPERKTWQVL